MWGNPMIQLTGILIIANTIIVSAWWLFQGKPWGLGFTTLTVLSCLIGLALVFNERAIELSFGQFGSIKTAAKQAQTDAKEISEIRKRIEAQAATMDLVARESAEAKKLLGNLSEQNKIAEEKIETIKELAAPPSLSVYEIDITNKDNVYEAVMTFSSSKNEPLGQLEFYAAIQDESNSKIIDFWPANPTFLSGKDSKKIEANGKHARLIYQLMGAGYPSIRLKTSGTAIVEIQGNHDLEKFQIEIK
jgi:hypothetical protein